MSIVSGIIWILSVPISYLMLSKGFFPEICYLVRIGLFLLVVVSNILITKNNIPEFDISLYLKKTALPDLLSMGIVLFVTYYVFNAFPSSSWWRFLTVCSVSTISVGTTSFFIVFNKETRVSIMSKVKQFLRFRKNA